MRSHAVVPVFFALAVFAAASCGSPAPSRRDAAPAVADADVDPPAHEAAPVVDNDFGGVVLTRRPGEAGWTLRELFEAIHEQAGIAILHDPDSEVFDDTRVEFIGDATVPADRMIEWLRAVLAYHRFCLIPIGVPAEDGAHSFFLMRSPVPYEHGCLLR